MTFLEGLLIGFMIGAYFGYKAALQKKLKELPKFKSVK